MIVLSLRTVLGCCELSSCSEGRGEVTVLDPGMSDDGGLFFRSLCGSVVRAWMMGVEGSVVALREQEFVDNKVIDGGGVL